MSASTQQESERNQTDVQNPSDATQQAPNEGCDAAEQYVAPFFPYHGVPLNPYRYMVTFYKGHTLEKHWQAIGIKFGTDWSGDWYSATLSDDQRERVRRDPGVKEVRQYGQAEWG
jgi:hypothetical protein